MFEASLKLKLPMDHPLARHVIAGRNHPTDGVRIDARFVVLNLTYNIHTLGFTGNWMEANLQGLFPIAEQEQEPIPMLLTCPVCSARHVDEGEFATKVHYTHSCQSCGMTWRPALVPTVGVRFLPGFKNEDKK